MTDMLHLNAAETETLVEILKNQNQQWTRFRAANILRDREWNPEKILSLSFRGNELGGEIGEAQNILKKIEREKLGLRGSKATVEQLAEELADGHICLDLIAMEFGIDSWRSIVQKFNKTSEWRGLSIRL